MYNLGTPSEKIPLSVPHFFSEEKKHLQQALNSNQIAVGPHVKIFENEIVNYLGAECAVAVNSGTAAIELAIVCSRIEKNEHILVPAFTYSATVNAIISAGCKPFFFDICSEDLCADHIQLETFLSNDCVLVEEKLIHKSSGSVIGGILIVHMYGNVCNMDGIQRLCNSYGIELIEDGTEALGASYKGQKLGCESRYFALSFNGNKLITSGGGGMLVSCDKAIIEHARELANQGKSALDPNITITAGHNYRMPNLNAALACDQVFTLNKSLEKKRIINNWYKSNVSSNGLWCILTDKLGSGCVSSHWMSIMRCKSASAVDLDKLVLMLSNRNIEARRVWKPLHEMPAYAEFPRLSLQNSADCYLTDLCLPSSVGSNSAEINYVCKSLDKIFSGL